MLSLVCEALRPTASPGEAGPGEARVTSRKTRVFVRSLGCKVNLADAAAVLERLDPGAVAFVSTPDDADVVLLNTCTVTHRADRDVRKILGSLGARRPDLPVVVTGCGAIAWSERLASYPNVRRVMPPGEPGDVAEALGPVRPDGAPPASGFARLNRKRAFAKVQDGCDARCAYCTIPRVRGPQRSLPLASARKLVRRYLDCGHLEIVLTGIHLGRYGADLEPRVDLAALLDAIAPDVQAGSGQARLRLSSIEPLEWSDRLLAAIERHPFVCRHFHVPLQSGDDRILRSMGRPYGTQAYTRVVTNLRTRLDGCAIGADVLVGFPGEDDRAAGSTLELLGRLPVDYLHVFPFSARPGTRAADLPGAVAAQLVKQRAAALRRLGRQRWLEFTARGQGQVHRVLLERQGTQGLEGRSEHYRRVRVAPSAGAPGEIVEALATRSSGEWLLAQAIQAGAEVACRLA